MEPLKKNPAGHGLIQAVEERTWRSASIRFNPTGNGSANSQAPHIPLDGHWKVPKQGIRLKVTPEMANQELHNLRSISTSYWEGSVNVSGTVKGEPVTGKGYVELVGYTQPLKQELPGIIYSSIKRLRHVTPPSAFWNSLMSTDKVEKPYFRIRCSNMGNPAGRITEFSTIKQFAV